MTRALIALGSNLGDCRQTLARAIADIRLLPETRILSVSRLYSTSPVSEIEQSDFLNAAALIETELEPYVLLELLQSIEQTHGRTRTEHWGPRTLDLDIIDIEGFVSSDERLSVPHPLAIERAFVLHPLNDLAPEWVLGELRVSELVRPTHAVSVVAEADWCVL